MGNEYMFGQCSYGNVIPSIYIDVNIYIYVRLTRVMKNTSTKGKGKRKKKIIATDLVTPRRFACERLFSLMSINLQLLVHDFPLSFYIFFFLLYPLDECKGSCRSSLVETNKSRNSSS